MPDLLSTGSTALLAFQRALATVSHNVANVATEGYSRQRVNLSAQPGQDLGRGYIGAGVRVDGVQRLSDDINFARRLDSDGELGRLQQMSGLSGRIDKLFSDSATSLAGPWSGFFDSAQGVSAEPASNAARQNMLAGGRSLIARLSLLDGQLDSLGSDVNAKLRAGVDDANRLAIEIAKLNETISRSSGEPSPDLLDQRATRVSQLGSLIGATTVVQDDGALNVFTPGGQPLVLGNLASSLATVANPFRGDRLEVALQANGGPVPLGNGNVSGTLGGLLEFRQNVLDPTSAQLGRIAVGMAETFNQQHRAGMDLNGLMGGDFFTLPAPVTATHIDNTGTATLQAQISDVSALDGHDLLLSFNGAAWSAKRSDTGAAVALTGTGTAVDPFIANGVSIVVSGGAAAGDRFLVQPTTDAAGGLQLAITDPNRIAAASPVRVSADLSNLGSGQAAGLSITDATDPALLNPVDIQFIDSSNYTLNGVGPFPFSPGGTVAGNGWSLRLDGIPAPGDTFRVVANSAGSSDNGNARQLANIDDALALNGGTGTFNGALGQLTVSIGSTTRQANFAIEGQQVIHDELQAQRESLSGVNLDEEAANLLRFQQAYQAAAQVISTADTLFQSLINAVRR